MKKVLVIRFSSIGDIVLTTPVVRCLKQQLKGVEVHYLTKAEFKSILEINPFIDKLHVINKNVKEILPTLKAEKFDYIIDLHNNFRSFQVKWALHTKSAAFHKLNFEKWLLVNIKINIMPQQHVVDRYMAAATALGIVNDNKGLDYFIPEKDEVHLNELPATHQNGYIGFVIGAKHFTKKLPAEKIVAICRQLNKPIVLLGGKEDVVLAKQILKAVGPLLIYNACGNYNLNQSASLIKQATRIITHDTGLMHIASAFKKSITSIWGNTTPLLGFAPYLPTGESESIIIEVPDLNCRPCSKIGYDKCPKQHFKCMQLIDERSIT